MVFSPELARMGARPFQQRDSDLEMRMIQDQEERIAAAEARIAHYDDASLLVLSGELQDWANAYPTMDPVVAYEAVTMGIPFDSEIGIGIAKESTAFIEEQRQASLPFVGDRVLEGSGEALFSNEGRFVGYSELDDDENDLVVRFVQSQQNGPNADFYNGAIQDGTFNAADMIRQTRSIYRPYNELIGKVSPDARGYNAFIENVYLMPNTTVASLNEEFGEGVQFNSSMVISRVRDLVDENDDWREANVLMTEEERASAEQINAYIEEAREERERLTGGGDTGIGSLIIDYALKPAVRGAQAGAISAGNYFNNNARQYLNLLGTASETAVSQEAFGGVSGGGDIFQQPTVFDPDPLTTQARLAYDFAGGFTGLATEAITLGAAGAPGRVYGRLGFNTLGQRLGARAFVAGAPQISQAAVAGGPSAIQQTSAAATDLGVLFDNPDLAGDGWLLGSDLIAERQRREAEFTPTFENGDYFTWGRAVARSVGFELDTVPYNTLSGAVDAFIAFRGPGEVIPDAAAEIGLKARYLPGVRQVPLIGRSDPLINAGGIRISNRPSILRSTADEWLSSWRGRLVAKKFAEIDDVYDIMSTTNNKMDLHTARLIANAKTADEVTDILKASVGINIQQTPQLSIRGSLKGVARPMDWSNPLSRFASRMLANVPQQGMVSMRDGTAVYKWADDYMKNASVPVAVRKDFLNKLGQAPVNRRFDVIIDIEKAIAQQTLAKITKRRLAGGFVTPSVKETVALLSQKGAAKVSGDADYVARMQARTQKKAEELVETLTRHFKDTSDAMTKFNVDAVGKASTDNTLARRAGPGDVFDSPHLDIEFLRDGIPLPGMTDIRQLRKLNKPMYDLLSNIPLYRELDRMMDLPRSIVEALTIAVFKPFAIVRPAYIVRVVTEEQFRIAAVGGDAFVNNPMAWASWVVMGKRGLGKGTDLDLNLKSLQDSPQGAMVRMERSDEARVVGATYSTATRGQQGFVEGWAGEMSQLNASPVAVHVAANPMRRVQQGAILPGQRPRFEYSDAELDFVMKEFEDTWRAFAEGDATSLFRQKWDAGDQRGAVSDYLETVERRIQTKTGGSTELREAIAVGELNGIKVQGRGKSTLQANSEFVEAIGDAKFINYAPESVKVQKLKYDRALRDGQEAAYKDFLNVISSAIIEKPTTWWSRSPVFRQNYWNGVAEHAHLLSRQDALKLKKKFENTKKQVDPKIRQAVNQAVENANGPMRLKDFDLLIKGQAVDKTNDLLFSMATRQQWQDAARVVAPFAAAWQEVITTWSKIILDDPFKLGRLEQAKRVIGDPDFSATIDRFPGFETIDGQGLIYTDDYGEKRIVVPFAGLYRKAARAITNAPELPNPHGDSVRLDSLNVGAGFLPGLGPVASIGVSELLNVVRDFGGKDFRTQKTPFGTLEEVLFPFGESSVAILDYTTWGGLVLPSWLRYLTAALAGDDLTQMSGPSEDAYNGRVIAAMQWLMMNDPDDRYSLDDVEKRERLMSDARAQIAQDAWVSAFSAALGPGPARREAFILDDDGNVQMNVDSGNASSFMTYLSASTMHRTFLDEATEAGLPYDQAEAIAWARVTELTGSDGFIKVGKTRSMLLGSVPVTRDAYEWLLDNPEVRTNASRTWQFFAPYEPDGELYMPMYLETIEQGERNRLRPQEWLDFAQDITAQRLYDARVRSLGSIRQVSEDAFRAEINEYADNLQERFPQWRNTDRYGSPASIPEVQFELGTLTSEGGRFENHPIAPAVQEALGLREVAEQRATDAGLRSFLRAGSAVWIRELYDAQLVELSSRYPEASFVIDRAFRSEIRSQLLRDVEGAE